MAISIEMATYNARVASFNITYPLTKKRSSDFKGTKTLKWPHRKPNIAQLATAGFFYRPTPSNPDNVTCYLCGSSLDGWEKDDNALTEHLKHAPDCGWAISVGIEHEIENGSHNLGNPLGEKPLNARKMTFGSRWPHENKRGWICKTQKMVESGWYYCPTEESDDFARCSYCSLSLDGWEPKDDPFDEHQRRSPDCTFFSLLATTKSKSGRPKKTRVSRMSQMSDYSTTFQQNGLAPEPGTHESTTLPSAGRRVKEIQGKEGGKNKKATARAKKNATLAKAEESAHEDSFIEPEDDDFEVKVDKTSVATGRSRKRTSEEMNDDVDANISQLSAAAEFIPQSAKRRVTRTRSSTLLVKNTSTTLIPNEHESDTSMADRGHVSPPSAPTLKKAAKRGRKRGSSTSRKVSRALRALKASQSNTTPVYEDIDATLEADLDRPLTDEEVHERVQETKPKLRRLTRTKPDSKHVNPPTVPPRRAGRTSSSMISDYTDPPGPNLSAQICDDAHRMENHQSLDGIEDKISLVSESIGKIQGDIVTQENIENETTSVIRDESSINRQSSPQVFQLSNKTPDLPNSKDNISLSPNPNISINESQTHGDGIRSHADNGISYHEPKKGAGRKGLSGVKKKKTTKSSAKQAHKSRLGNAAQHNDEETVSNKHGDTNEQAAVNAVQDAKAILWDNDSVERPETAEDMGTVRQQPSNLYPTIESSPLLQQSAKSLNSKAPESSRKSASPSERHEKYLLLPGGRHETTNTAPAPVPMTNPQESVTMRQITPPQVASPQSSDAENQPPSSRPPKVRPPLSVGSPSRLQTIQVPLATSTPTSSFSKKNISRLHSAIPWKAIDLERIFLSQNAEKENDSLALRYIDGGENVVLSSPERKLTVEEWLKWNAQEREKKLRSECERLVGTFEGEGVKALKTLEGITCVD